MDIRREGDFLVIKNRELIRISSISFLGFRQTDDTLSIDILLLSGEKKFYAIKGTIEEVVTLLK